MFFKFRNKTSFINAFLTLVIIFLSGTFFFHSCQKDLTSDVPIEDTFSSTNSRENEDIGTFRSVSITDAQTITNKRKAVAYAISKEISINPAFRNFLYSQFAPNQYRFKEVVLGAFKDKLVNSVSVGSLLNTRLKELPIFQSEVSPLETILAQDKLLTLWIPHEYAYSLQDEVWSSLLPIYVDNISDSNFYLTDKVTDLNTTEELFMLHLSEAKNFKLLNLSTGFYPALDANFTAFHGFGIQDCQAVYSHLSSLPDYPYAPGYKLVDPVDDVYIISNQCGSPNIPEEETGNFPPPENEYECQRASFQLKLRGEFNNNSNHFVNMRLASNAAKDLLDSHPCNKWLQNDVRPFQFNWAYAKGGEIQDQPRNKVEPVYRTQLVQKNYKWVKKTFLGITIGWTLVYFGETLLTHNFPISHAVFSEAPADNHWTPQGNGDIVRVDVKVAHLGTCTNTSQTASTESYKISGSVKFGLPKVENLGTGEVVGGFEQTSSQTKTVTFQISAPAVYDLGRMEFEYCQPYPGVYGPPPASASRGNWNIPGTTGTIIMNLRSPWFNN